MSHGVVCKYHYRENFRVWLTSVTVWLFFREGVAKCPCKCGSVSEIYSIRIQYSNGYVDLIGCDINGYYSPDGNNEAQDGWYCVENRNDFAVLFAQYIDKAVLPIID